jgi:hypothetical protein
LGDVTPMLYFGKFGASKCELPRSLYSVKNRKQS